MAFLYYYVKTFFLTKKKHLYYYIKGIRGDPLWFLQVDLILITFIWAFRHFSKSKTEKILSFWDLSSQSQWPRFLMEGPKKHHLTKNVSPPYFLSNLLQVFIESVLLSFKKIGYRKFLCWKKIYEKATYLKKNFI